MKLNQLIAKRTKRLLKDRQWTQYHLSKRSAVSNSTLSNMLNCKCNTLTVETCLNICRGFDISIADFFNDELFNPENIEDNE